MTKRWEREAVVLQCAYALAQGLGRRRELTPAQLEKLRERLVPILDEVGLEAWNPRIGMRRFREAGKLAAKSKKKGWRQSGAAFKRQR